MVKAKEIIAVVLLVAGIVGLLAPMRPAVSMSVGEHGRVLAVQWIPSMIALLAGSALLWSRRRIVVMFWMGALAMAAFVWLRRPVCDAIPDSDVPAFETVIPLEERARRGEPFCKLDGHWYQCKSWIAREFFF